MDIKNDLMIDENALDLEWLNQPSLAFKYGEALSNKEWELAQLELELEIETANLINKVNANPAKYVGKDTRPTENNVKSWINTRSSIIELKKEILKKKKQVKDYKIAFEQIDKRKSALENLVKLLSQEYFAAPISPRDLSYEVIQKRKQKSSEIGIAKKMKRTKKSNIN